MPNISFIPTGSHPDLTEPRALAYQYLGEPSAYYAEFYITYSGLTAEGYFIVYAESADAVFPLPTEPPVSWNTRHRWILCQRLDSQSAWYATHYDPDWTADDTIASFTVDATFTLTNQTISITYDGHTYEPTDRDERIFAKEYGEYAMNVGVAVNESSSYSDYIYSTRMYTVVLRWTSPVTNESYSYNVDGLTWYIPTHTTDGDNNYFLYTKSVGGIGRALRMPIGKYASADIPTNYSDLTDLRSVVTITLSQLVDYMATVRAGESEQSVFTVISADFMIGTDLLETKTCDYSVLFGNDIDITQGTISDPNDAPGIDDTNVYTDSIALTVPTLTGTGVFNRCYVLDANGVNDLCDFLYNANDSIFDEIIDGVLTRGNPIESLIDLRLYPFDVRAFTGAGTAESIKFGRTDTEIIGTKLPHNANAVISLGSAVVPREYDNFLDYKMDCKLYIPFCGVCDLPIDRVLNHTISIKLIVDYITGACTAVVFVDQLPLLYQPGVIGVSIPMTATNSAEFGKTIIGNLVTGAKAAASGDAAQAAGALTGTASALWEGSHIQSVGSSSPQTALYQPKNAYLLMSIVNPPKGVYDTTYADNIGYACFMPMNRIGDMDGAGLTAFDNVKLDISQATEAEKTELLQLLKSGVFM